MLLAAVLYSFYSLCSGFIQPTDGAVLRPYAPSGTYSGHWGVDLAAEPGISVRAPVSGVVSFVGSVAGVRSVTIRAESGLRFSVSSLRSISVTLGDTVRAGSPIGTSGFDHGLAAVHLSVRSGERYLDPMSLCRPTTNGRLRLVPDLSSQTP